ncbi:MAG TPA: CocE/NonD family hydrolase, partial [Chitinophagaceae bacterium]|nr:CocE/NonD family hydrolase [Chitinophagaceae bacterium]
MKKLIFFLLAAGIHCNYLFAQADSITAAMKSEVMIPMRDGVKLHTVIITPVNSRQAGPILLTRTPYGAFPPFIKNDTSLSLAFFGRNYGSFLKDGYFLIFQDIRGKYKSEG